MLLGDHVSFGFICSKYAVFFGIPACMCSSYWKEKAETVVCCLFVFHYSLVDMVCVCVLKHTLACATEQPIETHKILEVARL